MKRVFMVYLATATLFALSGLIVQRFAGTLFEWEWYRLYQQELLRDPSIDLSEGSYDQMLLRIAEDGGQPGVFIDWAKLSLHASVDVSRKLNFHSAPYLFLLFACSLPIQLFRRLARTREALTIYVVAVAIIGIGYLTDYLQWFYGKHGGLEDVGSMILFGLVFPAIIFVEMLFLALLRKFIDWRRRVKGLVS